MPRLSLMGWLSTGAHPIKNGRKLCCMSYFLTGKTQPNVYLLSCLMHKILFLHLRAFQGNLTVGRNVPSYWCACNIAIVLNAIRTIMLMARA
jgi:hypothetical protein